MFSPLNRILNPLFSEDVERVCQNEINALNPHKPEYKNLRSTENNYIDR